MSEQDSENHEHVRKKRGGGRPKKPQGEIIPFMNTKIGVDSMKVMTIPIENIEDMNRLFKSMVGKMVKQGIYYVDEVPHRIRATVFLKGLRKYLTLHKFLGGNIKGYSRINYPYYEEDPLHRLAIFKPSCIQVMKIRGKTAILKKLWVCPNPVMPPITITPDLEENKWTWITSIHPTQKCPRCGICWTNNHQCRQANSAFYWMSIEKSGRELWQHVKFKTASSPPNMKMLFITYDIETYTIHVTKGLRMMPFMLCFKLTGDEQLVSQASSIARQQPDILEHAGGFYWINCQPGHIGKMFRKFRTHIQIEFSRDLVKRFYQFNQDTIDSIMCEMMITDPNDLPYDIYLRMRKVFKIPVDFYQVSIIIVGHNICKFDEILLSSEIMENKELYPKATKCERAFMPRAGRLLFNDIYFSLPNPLYNERDGTRTNRWKDAVNVISDYQHLSVKFTVRDTCQLTGGAKLRKAAQAYALTVSKGECPYEAINSFISSGYFNMDKDGFPTIEYWENESIMQEQKQIWQTNHPEQPYSIIQACLEYCMLDVTVTEQLAMTILENYNTYFQRELGFKGFFNIFERPTIPSNTHALWKQLAFTEFVVDQEKNKKSSKTKVDHKFVAQLYAPHKLMFKYIRQALRGGRCYPTHFGPFHEPVFVFDICGMYASALTHPLPHGPPLDPQSTAEHVNDINFILLTTRHISYFDSRIKPSILKVEAHPPPIHQLDPLPPICSRKGGRLVWTNESLYDEVITIIDIITLHNRGWKVKVHQDPMNVVFREWKTLCAEYVGRNIKAKEKADKEGNEIMRSISKLLSNSLYGAFATNMDTTRIIFEQDLTQEEIEKIHFGEYEVSHVTILNDSSFGGSTIQIPSAFESSVLERDFNPPLSQDLKTIKYDDISAIEKSTSKDNESLTDDVSLEDLDDELQELNAGAYIDDVDHAHIASANDTIFKPLTLLDAPAEAITVLHIEKSDKLVENNRYATQIACFVLGWSRAFFSEWAEIIHGPDSGTHPHDRKPQSLYGDTDSIFVTKSGYDRMITRGYHRIKKPNTQLIFDPKNPKLTWACECDIKCKKCNGDTFSSESIFLAPKLYALKDAHCVDCGHVGHGKLRAKGHPGEGLLYDTLLKCWQRAEEQEIGGVTDIPELSTSRTIFKKTLLNKVSKYDPFTLYNERLTRVLRPWKDKTLYAIGNTLHPYNNANPNPRNEKDVRMVEDFSAENPLEPIQEDESIILDLVKDTTENEILNLDYIPELSVDECDSILSFF